MADARRIARERAAALLEAGELRAAADVYREAGLYREAIHLYVDVLGLPGEAAPLVAAADPHRAAELYELAGDDLRAAATWCVVARASGHPELYVEHIARLSVDAALEMLDEETAARPLAPDTALLHYRYARLLEDDGDEEWARQIYERIRQEVGDFKDVTARLEGNEGAIDQRISSGSMILPPIIPSESETSSARYAAVSPDSQPAEQWVLSAAELRQLTLEIAQVAARHSAPVDPLAAIAATSNLARPDHSRSGHHRIPGFERAALDVDLLHDDAVEAARFGPTIESLRELIDDRPCDLQNIEVYYRLGLAYSASGDWLAATDCFAAVEEGSYGYRDVGERISELRAWQAALGERITGFEASGSAGARYAIRGELGRGGMGVVYRAIDTTNGREVALKLLSDELTNDAVAREMFEREARAIRRLRHPNIVELHDVGVIDGRPFLGIEFVRGKTIDLIIAEGAGPSIIESMRIAEQVLDALAYAHNQGIVHRDIKPGNIMHTESGLVKVMDFGLSARPGEADGGVVAGSPAYMPPEQLDGGAVDERGDVFAVGVALYEMLTGNLPFGAFERSGTPAPIRAAVPAVPQMLDAIVLRALELDPDRRFQRARQMRREIHRILEAVERYART